jgi:chemotaxis protein methyltransferase CheR
MTEACDANITREEFEQLSGLVYKHCGINLHEGKLELVRARLAKQMRVGGFATARDYIERVLGDASGQEFTALIDALATNMTSFFRERGHFDYLEQTFLPRILAEKAKGGEKRIRAWSAGCSTGEEAYSLAMTLLQTTGGGLGWDIKLLATDISTRAVASAEQGAYEQEKMQSVPSELRLRYFATNQFEGRTFFDALPVLRNVIAFRHLNLIGPWPFGGPFDFIFCRNVMIYFDRPTQQKLVGRFRDCLAPGGILFTGHSESLNGIDDSLSYVQPTIYAKLA